jgi:hypothetical protein
MAWIVIASTFRAQGTPPEGEPPRFTVRADSTDIESLDDDQGASPEGIRYESTVTLTGETSFVEEAVMSLDSGEDRLRLSTIGQGFLGPSPQEGVLHGSVMWRVDGGDGRFVQASGLVVSNFTFMPSNGQATDHQILKLFVP